MSKAGNPGVEIQLDRTRRLVFDFNALAAIEKEFDANVFDQAFWETKLNATALRFVVWSALRADDPDLTLEQCGALMAFGNLTDLTQGITKAVSVAFPEGSGDPPPTGHLPTS